MLAAAPRAGSYAQAISAIRILRRRGVGTIAAGVTGVMDNAQNYEGQAPNAGAKIILAIVLFLLTLGISLVRFRNPDLFYKANRFLYSASYGVSFAIALVLAFLGGVILYGF